MRSYFKASVAARGLVAAMTSGASADGHALSGDLVIFSDMSTPAPRAVMEGMVERFGEMHPALNIELTIILRPSTRGSRTARQLWTLVASAIRSARSSFGQRAVGLTISTCGPTAMTSTRS